MNRFIFCLLYSSFTSAFAATVLYEGDFCKIENQNGKCVNLHECPYAKKLLDAKKKPQHCGFQGHIPIVCCLETSDKLLEGNNDTVGKKSSEKCTQYHRKFIIDPTAFAGGIPAEPQEFPHMALLGYGEGNNSKWLCGGTLISERFILTAAHCIESRDLGIVNKVRLGELDIIITTEDAKPRDYKIAEIFPHQNYKPPSHYHDIALLKLETPVDFSSYVKPACLHTEHAIPVSVLTGTGWGKTDFFGESSSQLLKADLDYVPHEKCAKSYADVSVQKLKNGIDDEIQICAGSEDGRDACQGDSGGPIQFKSEGTPAREPHYSVVGITSFGKACGVPNTVGVYTRVAPYTAWIENIVWS